MITDDQTQDKGFAARWDTVCGQNYQHESQGILENGNFGFGNYSADQNCIWNITGKQFINTVFLIFGVFKAKQFKLMKLVILFHSTSKLLLSNQTA